MERYQEVRDPVSRTCDLRPLHREARAGDERVSQADIGKARQLLGYHPVWRTREGLARAIDWYVGKLALPRRPDQGRRAGLRPYARSPIGLQRITDS